MLLSKYFDSVIMLTWSDWKTEPRSNRYHYATRFARAVPVLFVQPDSSPTGAIVEKTIDENIDIVHIGHAYDELSYDRLDEIIARYKFKNPLIWVYNSFFYRYLDRLSDKTLVYHATEAYLVREGELHIPDNPSLIRPSILETLKRVDLLVSVNEDVEASYVREANFIGDRLVLRNGCDFQFLADRSGQPNTNGLTAFYQGGVNVRLDFPLLKEIALELPDWNLLFCGRESPSSGWDELKAMPNVTYAGELDAESLANIIGKATVGIIPFRDDPVIRKSMPLKAFEYVACGLPVVSIPINALADHPDLFTIASGAKDFAAAIRRIAPSRHDPQAIERRLTVAKANSYDARFETLVAKLLEMAQQSSADDRKNIVILYDHRSTHISTIQEHVRSFENHSRHRIFYLAATDKSETCNDRLKGLDLYAFDAVVVHYSIRLSLDWHINHIIANKLSSYQGRKILMIQDEYETTDTALAWMDRFQFDIVYTCVPAQHIDDVYPRTRFPKTRLLPTLTGYVPEGLRVETPRLPASQRYLRIAYRGRDLPHQYGDLGREKIKIGVDLKRLSAARQVPVDIEIDSASRIYGDAWYDFLASARATLGTESGSNVFDFTGELAEAARSHPDMSYENYRQIYLGPHEGRIRMNQISPKIFEAISLRTALVLFEGTYSDVIEPHIHYFPLKKDYSNIDAMFAFLENGAALDAMTDRAYRDIIASGNYSYERFVESFDIDLAGLFRKPSRGVVLTAPTVLLPRLGNEARLANVAPGSWPLSSEIFGIETYGRTADAVERRWKNHTPSTDMTLADQQNEKKRSVVYQGARFIWRSIPWTVRNSLLRLARPPAIR